MTIKTTEYSNGIRRDYKFNDDGIVEIHSSQDVKPLLKINKEKRNSENLTGNIGEFKHYASVPLIVVEYFYKKGLDIFNRDDQKIIQREIETNFPYLKTTNLKGW